MGSWRSCGTGRTGPWTRCGRCCDGLKGLPDAIEATWPHAVVQTCVIHLLRNSFRFCSYKDRRAVAKALRPIYTAVNIDGRAKFNRLLAEGDPDGEVYEAWPAPS